MPTTSGYRGLALFLVPLILACNDQTGPADDTTVRYVAVTAGYYSTCALDSRQDLYCWGTLAGIDDSIPRRLGAPEPLTEVKAANGLFSGGVCGRSTTGRVYCWGSYTYGHDEARPYGDGVGTLEISGATGLTSLALGRGHGCGILPDSTVSCWGSYISGKRGREFASSQELGDLTAMPIVSNLHFARLALGDEYSCGILGDGATACWGDSVYLASPAAAYIHSSNPCWLASACTPDPVAVPGIVATEALSAAGDYACAVAGGVKCWGPNFLLGTPVEDPEIPAPVALAETPVSVGTGAGFACALTTSGAAYCWGNLNFDQSASAPPSAPVRFSAGQESFISLAVGFRHACAITERGRLYCWGEGGALGNNSRAGSAVPVRVAEPREPT